MAYALPERRVANDEIAARLGRSGDEITARTGIRERRRAGAGEGPSEFAARAARSALEATGWRPEDVELIVFATMTPDITFPGAGCLLQEKLGCGTIGALDLRAQCAGLPFALDVADSYLRARRYDRILLALGEVHSSGLDESPRGADVTPRFGDGAAVLLLDAGDGALAAAISTDPTDFERFWCEFPSSRRLPTRFLSEDLETGKHFPRIDEEALRAGAPAAIVEVVGRVLEGAKLASERVSRFFFEHVLRDVAEEAARTLGVTERADVGDPEIGHVASASLAISLCRARERGEVETGDLVCLATAGAGENAGAVVFRI
jgi:3-oxoacyl-[acyl-carrier-protein] synthase III